MLLKNALSSRVTCGIKQMVHRWSHKLTDMQASTVYNV